MKVIFRPFLKVTKQPQQQFKFGKGLLVCFCCPLQIRVAKFALGLEDRENSTKITPDH